MYIVCRAFLDICVMSYLVTLLVNKNKCVAVSVIC